MENIGFLIEAFNQLIENKVTEKEILPETKVHKILNFFFHEGNNGINALREMLEEINEDTVDVFFKKNNDVFECHISICYEYHDLEIVKYSNLNESECFKYQYKIIDTSRKSIEEVKKHFKSMKI